MMKLTAINKYPVKSLKAISIMRADVDDFGITNDRRWMLVNTEGKFVTQRQYPKMGSISVEESGQYLRFYSDSGSVLEIKNELLKEEVSVRVWGDEVSACQATDEVNEWFSAELGVSVALVYMPDSTFRQVDRQFADYKQRVSFSDGFPFLLISEASLVDLNSRLDSPVPMSRFRPNLVVSGCGPYEEDQWRRVRIGDIEFDVVKPCSRCVMTTIDESTLIKGREPLRTLATYRKNEYGVCFGQNLVHRSTGVLNIGDAVEILS